MKALTSKLLLPISKHIRVQTRGLNLTLKSRELFIFEARLKVIDQQLLVSPRLVVSHWQGSQTNFMGWRLLGGRRKDEIMRLRLKSESKSSDTIAPFFSVAGDAAKLDNEAKQSNSRLTRSSAARGSSKDRVLCLCLYKPVSNRSTSGRVYAFG